MRRCGVDYGCVRLYSPIIFFSHITTSGQSQAVSPSNVFISAPTRYAKYLRRVIMGWIGEKSIKPEHMVPSSFLRPELSHESQSDSDSDLDTPRVLSSKGDIDERDNTAENNKKGLCIQGKAERAGRTESTQSSKQHRGERGTGKSHQCPECEYSCVKLSNMKRHINRKHTRAVGKRAFQSGKCLCLECGH
ncbi:unnamed protein product [Pocillopora meandrina]|uniref:C2H2-type domain-containing protein n=1 Tax=Pocillopora meandrina TaxID=46732 RepID=A0AAU9VMK2_9CNID|nr:unnamed protein product [Pocillopora meandrina]